MRILALEPFHGGSHQAFLDGWRRYSQHEFTIIGLPAYKWKWRMRHAPLTLAGRLATLPPRGHRWDVLWCSDMLNLAEFRGLVPAEIGRLPSIAYFHENQLTYPSRNPSERDLHFAFSNFTTAVAADRVWFNSAFHRDSFLSAMEHYLSRMPDQVPWDAWKSLAAKSHVQFPGVESFPVRPPRRPGPLCILWNGRWEHDKNPDNFFAALRLCKARGMPFRLVVLGESFRQTPEVFAAAREELSSHLLHWGYAETREAYRAWLQQADVVVSTAGHEFFGIGIVEAMAAGAVPLLPNRLSYPELLRTMALEADQHLYDGTAEHLARRLAETSTRISQASWDAAAAELQQATAIFSWPRRAEEMDARVADLHQSASS